MEKGLFDEMLKRALDEFDRELNEKTVKLPNGIEQGYVVVLRMESTEQAKANTISYVPNKFHLGLVTATDNDMVQVLFITDDGESFSTSWFKPEWLLPVACPRFKED